MQIKSRQKLGLVSFPDYTVTLWKVDAEIRKITIITDGAFYNDAERLSFDRAELTFSDWTSICVRYFDAQGDKWRGCSYDYDDVKDICEFDCFPKKVLLKGFGRRSGQWMEFIITGGTVAIRLS